MDYFLIFTNEYIYATDSRRNQIDTEVQSLLNEGNMLIDELNCLSCSSSSGSSACDYGIKIVDNVTKVFQNRPFNGNYDLDNVQVKLAQNEQETFQIVVMAYTKDINGISVNMYGACLAGSQTSEPSITVEVKQVDYVNISQGTYPFTQTGQFPDLLRSLVSPLSVNKGQYLPFWVKITTTTNTPPGDYVANIDILPENSGLQTVKVHIHVWDFALPQAHNLKTPFCITDRKYVDYASDKTTWLNLQDKYAFNMLSQMEPYLLTLHIMTKSYSVISIWD
jgi:hypothetical protein